MEKNGRSFYLSLLASWISLLLRIGIRSVHAQGYRLLSLPKGKMAIAIAAKRWTNHSVMDNT
jgi:hypothetical protein